MSVRMRFHTKTEVKVHMAKHEGDGHAIDKCEDCSVNLRSSSSRKTSPVAGQLFSCDHQGCDFKTRWRSSLSKHLNQVHNQYKPFSCSHTGCSFRSATNSRLTLHNNEVHLRIRTKKCHVCDERFFFRKTDLHAHMSHHQTKDHDMNKCYECVGYQKTNHRLSQALVASHKRRAESERTKKMVTDERENTHQCINRCSLKLNLRCQKC